MPKIAPIVPYVLLSEMIVRAAACLPACLAPAPGEGGRQLRPGRRLGGGTPGLHGAAGWRATSWGAAWGQPHSSSWRWPCPLPSGGAPPGLIFKGQVRLRVLSPTGLITAIAVSAYALSATLWMPDNVTSNDHQHGIFGVALAWSRSAHSRWADRIVIGQADPYLLVASPSPLALSETTEARHCCHASRHAGWSCRHPGPCWPRGRGGRRCRCIRARSSGPGRRRPQPRGLDPVSLPYGLARPSAALIAGAGRAGLAADSPG